MNRRTITMCKELADTIYEQGFLTFQQFYEHVISSYDSKYLKVLMTYSRFFDRLIKGNYYEWKLTISESGLRLGESQERGQRPRSCI